MTNTPNQTKHSNTTKSLNDKKRYTTKRPKQIKIQTNPMPSHKDKHLQLSPINA
jgi:hypothetical protein